MINLIKKTILAGIGATVTTRDQIEENLDELVSKGRISVEEARDTAQKILESGRQEWSESMSGINEGWQDLLGKAHLATQAQLHALEERVKHLETATQRKPKTRASQPTKTKAKKKPTRAGSKKKA